MENRAGTWVYNLSGEAQYKSFCPADLPPTPSLALDAAIIALLVKANKELAILNAKVCLIPSADLFISMYIRKEALLSSQIEGTQCTLEDILDPALEKNVNADVADVICYIQALDYAVERMKKIPLSARLLKETHGYLLKNTRGQEKDTGEFRRSQNWIGATGCTLSSARYVPPNVDDMLAGISQLEKFIHYGDEYDPLINAGLIHYQFETIHPFLDGNGRVGRLLIMLYLIEKKIVNSPVLYISYFLKRNQTEYYDRLSEVRRTGNYEQWILFFLEALESAASDANASIDDLLELFAQDEETIARQTNGKQDHRIALFEYIKRHPIIEIKQTAQALGVSYNTISRSVQSLMAAGILEQTTNQQRNRVFVYRQYVERLKQGIE